MAGKCRFGHFLIADNVRSCFLPTIHLGLVYCLVTWFGASHCRGNVEHVFEQVACRTKTTNRLMFWVLVWRFIIGNINSLLELVVYLQVVCAGRSAPDKACPEEQGEACLKKPKRHTESVISARLFVLMLPCDYSRSDVVASQHARSLSR